jgi:hypothetical protein
MRTTNETSPDARAADDFDARKSAAMAELVFADDADAERADRSRAGRVDGVRPSGVRVEGLLYDELVFGTGERVRGTENGV